MPDQSETTTITTSPDGTTTIVSDGSPSAIGTHGFEIDGGSFFIGVLATFLALGIARAWGMVRGRRAALSPADAAGEELAALRKRTAVLERIVTDPGARVAHEIETLR